MSAEDIASQLKHRKSREIATVLGFLEKTDPLKCQEVNRLTGLRPAN
jgi:predicted transcriptional regulator